MAFNTRHKHYLKHQGHVDSVEREMKRKTDPEFQRLEEENKKLKEEINATKSEHGRMGDTGNKSGNSPSKPMGT